MSIKIAILVSGRGSNMVSLCQAIEEKRLAATVSLVFSNNAEAQALQFAQQKQVPTACISHKKMSRQDHENAVLEILARHKVDFVVLAGYMRVLSKTFLKEFSCQDGYYRVINIHPSLLPAFPGTNAYEEAFAYGVRVSGVTVHLVDEKVDHGPILAQESFPRFLDDTLETFKARGLALEHRLYPQVLQEIAINGVRFAGYCDTVSGAKMAEVIKGKQK